MTMISKTTAKVALVLNTPALGGCSGAPEHEKTPEELGVHAPLQPRLVCDPYERPYRRQARGVLRSATINKTP
jgi:hypothetical protein